MGETLRVKSGEVLATINADFYDMDKPLAGLPCGIIVRDGELLCSPNGWPALGFGKDGSRVILAKALFQLLQRGFAVFGRVNVAQHTSHGARAPRLPQCPHE
jgi:hypothetical protein